MKALEAAGEAAYDTAHPCDWQTRMSEKGVHMTPWEKLEPNSHARNKAMRRAEKTVAAYLDSLLGDIPAEAVETITRAIAFDGDPEDAAQAFLRSLRSSLGGTDGS